MRTVSHVTDSSNDTCVEEPMGSLLGRRWTPATAQEVNAHNALSPATDDQDALLDPASLRAHQRRLCRPLTAAALTVWSCQAKLAGPWTGRESPPAFSINVSNRP
nr:uncharacterized protein CTRU02_05626 [Colletotrichum truncatum]KAF6794069.1 hypothetical protein CTRU02_05626 [Colletotrichum truncatum]